MKKICGWDDSVFYLENINSLVCLFKSGLNDIFHWCAHSAVFCKSLFNSYAVVLASWIIENGDISSANNLTVAIISIDIIWYDMISIDIIQM